MRVATNKQSKVWHITGQSGHFHGLCGTYVASNIVDYIDVRNTTDRVCKRCLYCLDKIDRRKDRLRKKIEAAQARTAAWVADWNRQIKELDSLHG